MVAGVVRPFWRPTGSFWRASRNSAALAADFVAGGSGPGECLVGVRCHGPAVRVGYPVMVMTQHGHLVGVGVSAKVPGCDVMDYAPGGGGVAAGEYTSCVSDSYRSALGWAGQTLGTSEVKWIAVFIDDQRLDPLIAAQPGDRIDRMLVAVGGGG